MAVKFDIFKTIDFDFFFLIFPHYDNTAVQYTAIFHGCKNDNFQMKTFDIFLVFAQNIDRGTL